MATLFVFISTLFSALVAMQGQQALTTKDQAGEQNHIFRLVGTGSMYKMQVPGLDEEAMCFDVDLYNARNKIVGPATGCLSDIQPKADGLSNTGTTFFYLPQGSIVTRGKISIQPVLDETAHESGQPVTHLTGASSKGNTIIEGTGIYENSTGNIRLSDMVDMSNFEMNEGDLLSFNCLFEAHFFEVFTLHDFTKNEWNTFLIATTIFTCPIQISAVAVWIEQKIQSKLSIAAHYPAKKIPKHNIRNQAIPTAQHRKNT